MMRHLTVDYYVGWLTAAAVHGAEHQAPQTFHVATDRHVRDRTVGRTRFQFARRMIPAAAVTAWSVERPRPTRTQVEQDLLLSRAVGAIAQNEYLPARPPCTERLNELDRRLWSD